MAAPPVQGTRSLATFSGTTYSHTHGSSSQVGEALLVSLRWHSTATITSLTVTGETIELLGSPQTGGPDNGRSQWAIIRNIQSASAKQIDVVMSGSPTSGGIETLRISGQAPVDTVNVRNGASGSGANPSIGLTTTVNECLGFAILGSATGDPSAVGSPWSLVAQTDIFWYDSAAQATDLGSAGAKAATFTLGAGTWVLNAIAIAPAGGSPDVNAALSGSALTPSAGTALPAIAVEL